METISKLKRLRLEAGFKTIKEVERLTGIRGLGAAEAGKAPLTEAIYRPLAVLYNVSIQEII